MFLHIILDPLALVCTLPNPVHQHSSDLHDLWHLAPIPLVNIPLSTCHPPSLSAPPPSSSILTPSTFTTPPTLTSLFHTSSISPMSPTSSPCQTSSPSPSSAFTPSLFTLTLSRVAMIVSLTLPSTSSKANFYEAFQSHATKKTDVNTSVFAEKKRKQPHRCCVIGFDVFPCLYGGQSQVVGSFLTTVTRLLMFRPSSSAESTRKK